MGLLDGLLGGVLQSALGGGQQSSGLQGQLINLALGMLTKSGQGAGGAGGAGGGGGGLDQILGQFTQAGLGQQAQSWVGNGPNMPVSPDQLTQVFGQGQIQQWAKQLGVDHQQAAGGLAAALPELINQLTPKGQVPQASELDGLLGMLRGALK